MSFWDRYLAPGDIRAQREPSPAKPLPTPSPAPIPNERLTPPLVRIDAAHRARRQNALFYGGLSFTFLSLFITRRALRKRQPAFSHTPDSTPVTPAQASETSKIDGGLDAVEALFLATLNVTSIFMAAIGGAMKVFDVADLEDMREFVRRGVGYDVYGGTSEADRELEAWVADVLSRPEVKDGGVAGLGGLREAVKGKLGELAEESKRAREEAEAEGRTLHTKAETEVKR